VDHRAGAWPLLVASFAIPPRGGLGLAVRARSSRWWEGILWVQATYDLYQTGRTPGPSYAPTGRGLGMLVYGLVRGDRELVGDGLRTTLVGLALFVGFALFFEGVIGLSGPRIVGLDDAWPVIAIGLGVLLVIMSLFSGRGERRRA